MKRIILLKSVMLALIVSAALAPPAQAYLDPSVGGQLFQMLAVLFTFLSAILLFFASYIKLFLARVRRVVRNLFVRGSEEIS